MQKPHFSACVSEGDKERKQKALKNAVFSRVLVVAKHALIDTFYDVWEVSQKGTLQISPPKLF